MILEQKTTNVFMQRQVVLVDEEDKELGLADIYTAHQGAGLKHRALSVILYRKKNGKVELLLQKRAATKPVFKLLWSNTCCTNMRAGDEYLPRAVSRLKEEMGIQIEENGLRKLYRFSYDVPDPANVGWCENELDTVMVGEWNGEVITNLDEAADYRWMEWGELKRDIEKNPDQYAPWYKMIIGDERFMREIE